MASILKVRSIVIIFTFLLLYIGSTRAFLDDFKKMFKTRHPTKPSVEDIQYLLRDRKEQSWTIMKKDGTVPEQWHEHGSLKVLFHGFSKRFGGVDDNMKVFRDQNIFEIGMLYGRENSTLNIILVDWTAIATGQYPDVVKNVPKVGKKVGEFLTKLREDEHIKDWHHVHLIGFDMGSHVAGVVGKTVKHNKAHAGTIGRITGLDPSNVGFDDEDGKKFKNENSSLSKEDAEFVDVIHCSMGKAKDYMEASYKGKFGTMVQAGHADFYPNGGESQKECTDDFSNESNCSHLKCSSYFAKSIKTKHLACLCDDYEFFKKGHCDPCSVGTSDGEYMGEHCRPTARGRYYITLSSQNTTKT